MMHPVFFVLFLGLLGGQIADIPLFGVRVSMLDVSVVLVLLVSVFRQKKRFIPSMWPPILGYAAATLFSVLINSGTVPLVWSGIGVLYVIRFLLYAALYWVAASDTFEKRSLMLPLLFSGVGIALLGFVQILLYPNLRNLYYLGWDPHVGRLFSTLLDPNFAGILLVFSALGCLGVLGKKHRAFGLAGFAISGIALVLTYSRSSILAFMIGLFVWGMLTQRKALMGSLIGVLAIGLLFIPHTSEGQNLLRVTSSVARLDTATTGFAVFTTHPLFGVGTSGLLYRNLRASPIPSLTGTGLDTSLLSVAASDGVIGLLFIGWLFWGALTVGRSGLEKSKPVREEAALYSAGVSALLFHSLLVNSLFYPWVMVWLFVTTGYMERRIMADR